MTSARIITLRSGEAYRRTGECDGCQRPGVTPGQCCTYIMLPLARPLTHDEQSWLQLHTGYTLVKTTEGQSVRIDTPCSALDNEGRCILFGSAARPMMCQNYPESPAALEGLPLPTACGYRFQRKE